MNKMTFTLLSRLCFLTFSLLLCFPAWANVEAIATVSKNSVSIDEVFELSISVNDNVRNQNIDLSLLETDFIYNRPSVSSSTTIINGKTDNITTWRISLQARHLGISTIPSLKISGLSTSEIKIEVLPNSSQAAKNNQDILFTAKIDKDYGYIGENFIYSIQLRIGTRVDGLSLNPPRGEGVEVSQYGKDIQSEMIANGKRYTIFNRKYQIKPTQAGSLKLSGAALGGSEIKGSGFNVLAVPFRRDAKDFTLQIKDKPSDSDGVWLPTSDLQISQEWQGIAQEDQVKVGEAINRIIKLKIKNISQSSMPNININYPDSVSVYSEQPEYSQEKDYSIMTIKQVLIPRQAGKLSLPALTINWFNTEAEQAQSSELEAKELKVLVNEQTTELSKIFSANNTNTTKLPATPIIEKDSGFWPWLSMLFATLWVITLVLLWREKKRPIAKVEMTKAFEVSFKQLTQAIKNKEIEKINNIYQMLELENLPNNLAKEIAQEIGMMQRSRYSARPFDWDNTKLLALIKQAKKQKSEKKLPSALADL